MQSKLSTIEPETEIFTFVLTQALKKTPRLALNSLHNPGQPSGFPLPALTRINEAISKVTCCLVPRTSSEDCVIWQSQCSVNMAFYRACPASYLTVLLGLSSAGGHAKVPVISPGAVCSGRGQRGHSANPFPFRSVAIPTLAPACQTDSLCCAQITFSLPHYSLAPNR